MHVLGFTAIVWAGSLIAGLVGALTGLGGGVVIVPLLTLALGVDIRYAIGASLVSVIATSSGSAVAYVREGFSNIRVGMLLEIATTLGATAGASRPTVAPSPGSCRLRFRSTVARSSSSASCCWSRRPLRVCCSRWRPLPDRETGSMSR
jgi:hypothetical protein